jgi:hypothetical protein
MNKFFEFQPYLDRQNNRPYFRGNWEKLQMEAFRLLPFQYQKSASGVFSMYQDSTEITDFFFNGSNKITGWTFTDAGGGGGSFSSTGSFIDSWVVEVSDYITSNNISLAVDDKIYFKWLGANIGTVTKFKIEFKFGGTVKKTVTDIELNSEYTFTASDAGNHTIVITITDSNSDVENISCESYDTLLDIYNGTNDYLSYDGSVMYGMADNGECEFNIKELSYTNLSDYTLAQEIYSDDCDVGCVNNLSRVFSGGGIVETTKTFDLNEDDDFDSGTFNVNKGDVITFYMDADFTNVSDYIVTLKMAGQSDVTMTNYRSGTSTVFYSQGTVLASGSAYINLANNAVADFTISNYDIEKGYSDSMVTFNVSSTVDYGTIHYAESGVNVWAQKWYKLANVRRSPSPKITRIGDEPNGVFVPEKVITSTTYKVIVKLIESEFNALLTATGGTVTVTDQTGTVFTCDNVELNEPDWTQGNGVAEFIFISNTSVHTLNNSDL